MKTHLPRKLLAALLAAMAVCPVTAESVTKSFGEGTYTYETSEDDTIFSTFIGNCTSGTFGTSKQGYGSNGWVAGIPVSESDRFATNVSITIGDGTTVTETSYVVGVGRRGYASTGDKSITVKANAHAGTIYAAYNLNKGHNSGLAVPGAESYYNNGKYFAPKAIDGAVISVTLDGGSALQIYGGSAGMTTPINAEMAAAEKALGSKEAAEAYAENNPAWALNEKIEIKIDNGKVGVTSDGNVHSSIANNPGITVIYGGGMPGASVRNDVTITVSGDSEVNGSITAGASSYSANAGKQTVRGFVNSTSVTISGGKVTGNVLGGGEGGIVKNSTSITLSGGSIEGNVYGAGDGDEVRKGTTVTLCNNAEVVGVIHGGGYNGSVVEGDRTLCLGTEDVAYKGTIKVADFTDIDVINGDVVISSYTPAEEGTNLTVEKNASLTINGDFIAETLHINGGTVEIINGSLEAESVTLGEFSYEVYSPGYVGGGDDQNGFRQDDGRVAVGLNIGDTVDSVTDNEGIEYFYNATLDKYVAEGATHWETYYINTGEHEVGVSEIAEASKDDAGTVRLELVDMSAGVLNADASVKVKATGGKIAITGQEVAVTGELSGDTSVEVTGTGSITGDNSHGGGTVIRGEGARLTVGSDTALGVGVVSLKEEATLDLGNYAVNNTIRVSGCTLSGTEHYDGVLDVSGDLHLTDEVATARFVSLMDGGSITGQILRTTKFEVDGAGKREIATSLTINDGGSIILNDGNSLSVLGNLVLGTGTSITLNGNGYAKGSELISWTGTGPGAVDGITLTMTEGGDYVLALDGKTIVLASPSVPEEDKPEDDTPIVGPGTPEEDEPTINPGEDEEDTPIVNEEPEEDAPNVDVEPEPAPVFDQATADVLTQSNWGIVSASRAFVDTVQGQRNNMGCIANGRGTAWASLMGGMTDISGSGAASGSDITLFGAAVGVDMKLGKRSSLGVAFGYTDGEVSADGLGEIDQETGHIALYGEHGLKKFANDSCLSLDWVTATGTTESKYMGAKWEQDSVQLNARLTWNKKVNDRLSYNVFGGLEYFASDSDRVQNCKSGSVQNLRGELGAGVRYVAAGSTRTAVDEKSGLAYAAPGCERVVLYGEVRYMNDMVRNNPSIEVDGLRGSGANPGRQGVGVEAGTNIRIGERWSVNANYSFNAMDDSNEHILNIGASRTF